MTIAEKTASLTKVINETVKELEVTQSSLDAQVSTAEGYKTTAETNQATAEGYRNTTLSHASSISSSLSTAKAAVTYAGVPEINQSATGTAVDVFVYDTSKDSDGGAWRKRTQHTSWYNEDINGKWLGFHQDETYARNAYANLGTELVTNLSFDTDSDWTKGTGWSISGGQATHTAGTGSNISQSVSFGAAGTVYALSVDVISISGGSGSIQARLGGTTTAKTISGDDSGKTVTLIYVHDGSNTQVAVNAGSQTEIVIDNISVREITSQTTVAGDYYQNTTDGKFYSLSETSGQSQVYRGNRREFPAVALISVEAAADKVVIYDADDPTLPMWMVFNASWSLGTGTMLALALNAYSPMTSTYMLNGKLAVGSTNTSSNVAGLHLIDFIQDKAQIRGSTYNADLNHSGIADRNLSKGLGSYTKHPALVSGKVRDVAMTVLPDAPIDPATGLPTPTIAVATGGGVSVIKDDGSVTDGSYTGSHNSLAFTHDNALWQQFGAYNIVTEYSLWSAGSSYNSFNSNYWDGSNNFPVRNNSAELIAAGSAFEAIGAFTGAYTGIQIVKRGIPLREGSKAVSITSAYNTGWMVGDIKGAFLSDTDDTDISDTELLVNGTFDTDTTGWTAIRDAIISVNANRLEVVMGPTAYPVANQYISAGITEGRVYKIEATLTAPASRGARIFIGNSGASTAYTDILRVSAGTTETVSTVFTATSNIANSGWINVGVDIGGVTGDTAYFDNISVKEVAADRSVNNNPLTVNGTITRSPVATGAELVGYSGFSPSNYLEQPYNSDLDFGTGDFCVMFWAYNASWPASSEPIPLYRGDNFYSTGNNIFIQISSGAPNVFLGRSASKEQITAASTLSNGVWSHVALVRSGSTVSWYVNGSLAGSGISGRDLTNSNAKTWIGVWNNNNSPTSGNSGSQYALLRISATAPTADQIKKMYEDEKLLFQENAACTLYGSSSAVTALAYDDSTNLLHVGTSAGRSVFDGLQRVDNTTTPVASAISASNGLIAED